MPKLSFETPVGPLSLQEEAGFIVKLDWSDQGDDLTHVLSEARAQIEAYFAGRLTQFDVPLRVDASPFVRQVCAIMQEIPFGETRTYGDIAKELGIAAQPVGRACGANPIPVLIPCHRILGANGLGGFSGGVGVETKVALLKHEGAAGLLL